MASKSKAKATLLAATVATLAALGLPTTASADIFYSYNFDLQDGPISVTGTAVLDELGAVDFEGCNNCSGQIFISDPSADFTASLTSPNLYTDQTGPSAWDVTPSSISFNFDAAASSTEFYSGISGDDTTLTFVSDGEIEATNSSGQTVSSSATGITEIAAATPEPSSLSLMFAGLFGLTLLVGVKRHRAHGLD
jgi:hypothetical protein